LRYVAVLRRRAHRLAEIGGVQKGPRRPLKIIASTKAISFARNVEAADVKNLVGIPGVNGAVVRRQQHQRQVHDQQ
jgi:Holliday junction resolvasome RuvABC DNA-binding subunit